MATAFVNLQVAFQSATTSWTVTKPTGTAEGDLLLAFLTIEGGYQAGISVSALPSGWAHVTNSPYDIGANWNNHAVAWKIAGGSEPADYTFTTSAAATGLIAAAAYSGVDNTTPFDITPATGNSGSATTSHVVASRTPTSADCMLIHVVTSTTYGGDLDYTPDAAMTERTDRGDTYYSLFVADQQLSGSSATGTRTHTTGFSDQAMHMTLLLRPEGGGGGGFKSAWTRDCNQVIQ